jgi:hypothetical protein
MLNYNEIKYYSREKKFEIALELYQAGELDDAVRALGLIVDEYPDDYESLYLYASILQDADKSGFAEVIFRRCTELYPERDDGWAALGTAIRDPERWTEAEACFKKALDIKPESTIALTNMASMYNEVGKYELGEKYARLSMAHGASGPAVHDTLGAALLGQEKWGAGWDENTYSLGERYRKEYVYGDEPRWDGTKGKAVIVYGEQGIGDEILYGSVIPDAIRDCKKVIVDCDHRLEGLFRRSFPQAAVYGTRTKAGNWMKHHKWDARCSMVGLSQFYRRKDFPGKPFLKPCPIRTEQWKHTLKGTNIGIAWNGGTRYTGHRFRRIPLEAFQPIYELGTCISLEYDKKDTSGFPIKWYDFATLTDDYDDTAALVANLDYVITTCTAVVHLAGGLGIPCYVLKNPYTSWRYAHNMPWYDSVELIDWQGSFENGIAQIAERINQRKVA